MFGVYRDESAMAVLRKTWEEGDESLQQDIFMAMQRVERALSSNPDDLGESRPGRKRILFDAPLAIIFTVDKRHRLVRILRAWTWRTRSEDRDQAA